MAASSTSSTGVAGRRSAGSPKILIGKMTTPLMLERSSPA
jgi:hypothetical protein